MCSTGCFPLLPRLHRLVLPTHSISYVHSMSLIHCHILHFLFTLKSFTALAVHTSHTYCTSCSHSKHTYCTSCSYSNHLLHFLFTLVTLTALSSHY
uniref:Uncharacterized protein n=1 Tax=Anguilla anguilla TaxID=7936 RepID=A0A0E9WPF6_ANGAN